MESFKPERSPLSEKRSAIWKQFEKYGKILALAALLSMPSMDSALANEKGESVDLKTKIEQLKDKAAEHVKNLVTFVKEKGQSGKMGQTPVKRWESPKEKKVTTVGYSEDESTAEWMTHESDDSTYRYYDEGADGSIDRIIINKDDPELGAKQKAGFNDLKTFSEMDDLADEAVVTADLNPEKVKVYEFNFNGEKHFIKIIDFETGEASQLSGPEATELTAKAQGLYAKKMGEIADKLEE